MRILLLTSGDLWAGAEVMLYQLSKGLREISGIKLCVVLLNKKRLAQNLAESGVAVKVIDESIYSFVNILGKVKKIVTEFSPDIIHSHRYKENLLAWLCCFGRSKIKLVATQHGMPETSWKRQNFKCNLKTTLFFRLLSSCFDQTVLVSEEMRNTLLGVYGFSNKNMTVIHNGISIPKKTQKHQSQRLLVGTAGRFFPVKDFFLLIDIARQVVAQNDTIDFVLAGDGPLYPELDGKIHYYGIQDRCRLIGHQVDMEVFYKNIDVYINTSIHEGIPMSVLEAMSHGLPIIAPCVGGFPEIVHNNIHGFLVKGRDKGAYVDCLLRLSRDDSLKSKMAKFSRKRALDRFSREAMAGKYYQLYKKLIATG